MCGPIQYGPESSTTSCKLQDEITGTIASRIEPEVGSAERSRADTKVGVCAARLGSVSPRHEALLQVVCGGQSEARHRSISAVPSSSIRHWRRLMRGFHMRQCLR